MIRLPLLSFFFFFNDTATTEIYTLSLHDALPIFGRQQALQAHQQPAQPAQVGARMVVALRDDGVFDVVHARRGDRKSTRLNSSHLVISYAVFCLKKKKAQ